MSIRNIFAVATICLSTLLYSSENAQKKIEHFQRRSQTAETGDCRCFFNIYMQLLSFFHNNQDLDDFSQRLEDLQRGENKDDEMNLRILQFTVQRERENALFFFSWDTLRGFCKTDDDVNSVFSSVANDQERAGFLGKSLGLYELMRNTKGCWEEEDYEFLD